MCGIVGVVGFSPVNTLLYDTLTVLQHRGQDSAGIITSDNEQLFLRKGNGYVRDVFHTRHMRRLQGNMGIGHVRYPTAGSAAEAEAQPFYVNSPYGITLVHNGNLTNSDTLKQELFIHDRRHINTNSDSEVLLNIFANELQKQNKINLTLKDIFASISGTNRRVKGAYSAVTLVTGYGLIAFRDPHGIRPLVYGYKDTGHGRTYMVASESVALDVAGFTLERDIEPGEAIFIDYQGNLHAQQCAKKPDPRPCAFEYIYLARPDSIIDKIPVHRARLRLGDHLGKKILKRYPNHDIDVVIPIPDTSRTAAQQVASQLDVVYREGFIKNRYIGRTFIMPGQSIRKKSVRQKLNPIDSEIRGKNVLLVDDSIVRGTTSKQIIEMARNCGARKVYFASAAPIIRHANVYGIDMPTANELIGHNKEEDEVGRYIGADWLVYQDLDALVESLREVNPAIQNYELSVFNGEYVTGDIDEAYLAALESKRSDVAKSATSDDQSGGDIGLHNDRQ